MSDYLKDHRIPYHTIGVTELDDINREVTSIIADANALPGDDKPLLLTYTLRYDGMGIIRRDFEEVQGCFRRAKGVDRLVFDIVGPKYPSNNKGKRVQIWFEALDVSRCVLIVADDDEKWVDNIFKRLSGLLAQYRNQNGVLRHPVIELFVQLIGVTAGFSGCVIFARLLSPHLNIPGSFFVLFVGLLLVFSNLWTYLMVLIGNLRNKLWPVTSFKRKPLGVVGQTVVGLVVTGILTTLLRWAWRILEKASILVAK